MHHGILGVLRVIHVFLQRSDSISRSDLVELAHIHEDTASRHLTFFTRLGLLKAVGKGRNAACAWAEPRFKTMSTGQIIAEAESREAGLPAKKRQGGKGGAKTKRSERGMKKPLAPEPAPRAPSGRGSPVWKKTVADGRKGIVWHKTDSDNLHFTIEDRDAVYEKIDPLFWIKVAHDDPGRLVGFTLHHFSRFRGRLRGAPFGAGGKETADHLLSLAQAAISWDMIESGEMKSAAGIRRFHALSDHVRALSSLLGSRVLVSVDENTTKLLTVP